MQRYDNLFYHEYWDSYADLQFCASQISKPYPIAIPNIKNATGEYYFNIGSYLDINCTHDLLCSIPGNMVVIVRVSKQV